MLSFLPTLNAILNTTSAVLLAVGRRHIKQGRRESHKKTMIATFAVSIVFLVSYLTYHAYHGTTSFPREGWIRSVYFTILTSHTILAAVVVPLAVLTLSRGLEERIDKHKKIARWTYPIWLYVSVTGVIVYLMLYHL